MPRFRPFLVIALVSAAACAPGGAAPAAPGEPELPSGAVSQGGATAAGDTLRVAFGQAATHAPSGLRATFRTLVSDGRCPSDATCVWEGDAVVRLHLERAGASADTTLHWSVRPGLGLHAVTLDGWEVMFFGLTPAPRASAAPPADSTRTAWLLVRRAGG